MCHFEDSITWRKSPLSDRVDFLYDNELDSDIEFLVGVEPDVCRFPGHRSILCKANPVFCAWLQGPMATHETTVVVEDVKNRAFDLLLRYLYGKEVSFKSAYTALDTLYAAHKYLCSGLIELCVKYLDETLNVENVLDIYTHARFYTVGKNREECEPSAPVATSESCDFYIPNHLYSSGVNNNGNPKADTVPLEGVSIPFWSGALLHNCLQFIDENADIVLNQESIEDMPADGLEDIVKRDTLKIQSEFKVFSALDRWANREIKRRKLNLNSENLRLVLGDMLYQIRFPFFSSEEFVLGPIQGGWLDQQELTLFSALISKSRSVPKVPCRWKPHMDTVCKKRMYNQNESFTLSQRTYIVEAADKSKDKGFRKNYTIFRKIKNKSRLTKEKNSKSMKLYSGEFEQPRSKCFPDFLIDMLICFFD